MKDRRWLTVLASAGAGTLLGCAAGAVLSGMAGSFSNGAFYASAVLFVVGCLGCMKGSGHRAVGPPTRGFTAGNVAVSEVGQKPPEHAGDKRRLDVNAIAAGLAAAGVLVFGVSFLAAKFL